MFLVTEKLVLQVLKDVALLILTSSQMSQFDNKKNSIRK